MHLPDENVDCSRREFLGVAALSGLAISALSSGCTSETSGPYVAPSATPETPADPPISPELPADQTTTPAVSEQPQQPQRPPESPAVEPKPAPPLVAKSHVVISRCHGCKYTDCVVVCPVEAFTEGADMLYIDPESCINCEACVPECPVEAILSPDERMWARAASERRFIALNAEMSKKSPVITAKKDPLAGPNCKAP